MTSQSMCPYGLKSLVECIARATLLSQPTDIPDFLQQYLSEMVSFRNSQSETDPKVVSFCYQELWENAFLGTTETPIAAPETSVASPEAPSRAEIAEQNVVPLQTQKKRLGTKAAPGKDKISSAPPKNLTPKPPPRVGRQFGKNVPPNSPAVKREGKPAPPPRHVSIKTRSKITVPFSSQQQSKETTDGLKKMTKTHQHILPPILKKSATPAASNSSTASKPSKLPSTLVPIIPQKLVLPPIPKRQTRGDPVSGVHGKGAYPEPRKASPMKREVVSEKTSSRSPAHRKLEPIKAKPKHKGASVPQPKTCQPPKEPKTESTSSGRTTQKVQKPEKKDWIQPNGSPERTRGKRVLWAERERVKPILDRTVGGNQATAFSRPVSVAKGTNNFNLAPLSSPNYTCPHLPHVTHIIRYRRMQVRVSPMD